MPALPNSTHSSEGRLYLLNMTGPKALQIVLFEMVRFFQKV
ncbi:4905_t:CDS:1, partial [Paraglomus brasilianum]